MEQEKIYGMTHTDGTKEEGQSFHAWGSVDPETLRRLTFRALRDMYCEMGLRKRPNLIPNYSFGYDEPGFGSVSLAVEDQTQSHLSALDAELEQAVKGVERTSGWILKKSSSGGSYVYNQRGGGTYHLPDEVAEMLHAFVSGDLLTALRLRDELHEALPVAP